LSRLLLVLGFLSGPLWALPAYRPPEAPWLETGDPRIEWKETWAATYKANTERWRKELESETRDGRLREQRLALRTVKLFQALLEHFPADAEGRIAAPREIADRLWGLGCGDLANAYLKKLVDESPGRPERAAELLHRLLERTHGTYHTLEYGAAWVRFAADRLIALHRQGVLPEKHPAVELAWKARLALHIDEGEVWEAAKALEALGELARRDVPWRLQEAELLLAAGRGEDAFRLLQELAEGKDQGHLRERVKQLAREREEEPDPFPANSNLEMRWDVVRARKATDDPDNLRALLDEGAKTSALVPWGESRHTSLWAAVDRHLLAQEPAAVAPLRQAHGRDARGRAASARRAGDTEALVALYRRYAWANEVHDALLEQGERLLRQGHSGLALRCFEDVLTHAAGPDARAKAQVGLWLALANDAQDPKALEAAFKTSAAAELPWLGERRPAAIIRERLLAALEQPERQAPSLADLEREAVRLPAVCIWGERPGEASRRNPDEPPAPYPTPSAQLQLVGRRVLASGPRLLACFGDDLAKPLWWRTPNGVRTPSRNEERGNAGLAIPGPFRPAVADGRVYTRWGISPVHREMTDLAAFDLGTGQMLWCTTRDPDWRDLAPISDPAAADGRLYVLALHEGFSVRAPVYLVCLDAQRGTLLWRRHLASQSVELSRASGAPDFRGERVDLARYGNAPTVSCGAVYCSTNLGFIARCDARDGLVEWAYAYPRARLGRNLCRALGRQGLSPLVAGDALILAPRDYAGAFALDPETGRLLWDNAFIPSDDAVGPVGSRVAPVAEGTLKQELERGTPVNAGEPGVPRPSSYLGVPGGAPRDGSCVVLKDEEHLVAVDAASGRVAWERRFPEGIEDRPTLAGSSLILATPRGLARIAADTGRILEERLLDAGEPIAGCVVREGALIGARADSVADELRGKPLNPQAPAAVPLQLPLKESWRLPRANLRLLSPPRYVKAPGKLLALSEGVLECVAMSARGATEWQRVLAPGHLDILWTADSVLFVYPQKVLALDGMTGARRWEAETPFRIRDWALCGPYLFLGRLRDGRHACMLRLATGERLWHRRFLDTLAGEYNCPIEQFAWDGKALHLFTNRLHMENGASPADIPITPEEGRVLAVRRFPTQSAKEDSWPVRLDFGDGFGFSIARDRTVWEVALSDGSALRHPADLKGNDPNQIQRFDITGNWLQIDWDRGPSRQPGKHWVLRRGDPAYALSRDYPGTLQGDRLYERAENGAALVAVDLPTRKETRYELPSIPNGEQVRNILDFREIGNAMWLASACPIAGSQLLGVRLDAFDRETGRHLGGQVFPGILSHETQVAWFDGAVAVTSPQGLHCLAPGSPAGTPDRPIRVAHFAAKPITPEGSLDDWPKGDAIPIQGPGGLAGRLRLAHDGECLYLAVSYPSPHLVPRVGADDCGGGDWLEVGVTTPAGSSRWGVGLDARGHVLKDRFEGTEALDDLAVGIRHDPAACELTYELAIPLKGALRQDPEARRVGVSLAVWDEKPGGNGPERVLTWGGALASQPLLAQAHESIYLHPLSHEQDEAVSTLARELPDLPESWAFLRRACRLRASSPSALADYAWEFIRRNPRSVAAERLLFLLDESLRLSGHAEPSKTLLDRAAQAGVPEPVRKRYEIQSKAYISQWVRLGQGQLPRSLTFELYDGTGIEGWEHRSFWGDPAHAWSVPPRRMGPREDLPLGVWHELRIPLYFIDMHDKPICGINFCQQLGPRIVWDHTVLVFNGQKFTLIGDEQPGGTTHGTWEWVSDPVRSGKRAHMNPVPTGWPGLGPHGIQDLDTPFARHVLPPLDRPYLSQWVHLDPANPPKTVTVSLHDGQRWRTRFVWGERSRLLGIYAGPLPPLGQWHELRLPLASTPFLTRPILGLAFGQCGGRAFWDRTALVANGQETVLVEDEAPPLHPHPPRRAWHSWVSGHHGETKPMPGKVGTGLGCDGRTGYVEAPASPELDPEQLSLEAWVYVDHYPAVGDSRRWIVSKNFHESTDGHFALVVNRDQAGAYLNIGGGQDNRFQAWSRPGTLTLKAWHHLAMAYDGVNLRLYLDAELAALVPIQRERTPGKTSLQIGRRVDGYAYFEGIIDEVRLYNRALTAAEIRGSVEAANATPPKPGPPAAVQNALVAAWSFDDDAPAANPLADWQWVAQPAKSGQRAHTHAVSRGYTDHFVFPLKDPIIGHLPFDRSRAVAILTEQIPKLGKADEAWRFFQELLQLNLGDPKARGDLCKWFLKTLPGHPRAADVLGRFLESQRETDDPAPDKTLEAFVQQSGLPLEALYPYHQRYAYPERSFVQAWRLIGPFPNPGGKGIEVRHPPETDGLKADKSYPGSAGEVAWRLHESESGFINLKKLFEPNASAVAYASCWVYSEKAQPIVLAVGSDDDCKVWLNRGLALTGHNRTYASPGEFVASARLSAGWNEVLVKITQATGEWGFYFEILDPLARQMPDGLKLSPTGP